MSVREVLTYLSDWTKLNLKLTNQVHANFDWVFHYIWISERYTNMCASRYSLFFHKQNYETALRTCSTYNNMVLLP